MVNNEQFCLGAVQCNNVSCPLKRAVELTCNACILKPVPIKHRHTWDNAPEFTHAHRHGDRPHGHHGARYGGVISG